ncbi:MAG: hypothetical protein R3C14_15495 [Caldilineaceae bacterium]
MRDGGNEPSNAITSLLGGRRVLAYLLPHSHCLFCLSLKRRKVGQASLGLQVMGVRSLLCASANVSISLRGASTVATDTAQIVLMDGTLEKPPFLFAVSPQFHTTMQRNVTLSIIPAVFCVAGVFVFHWGLLSSFLIYNLGLLTGLLNSSQPLAMIGTDDDSAHNDKITVHQGRLLDVKHA